MTLDKKIKLTIYTDGACSGNPGPGGWGVLLQYGDKEKTLKGGDPKTTNNRMEMMAAIKAIESVNKTYTAEIILWTDSTYVMKGITEWIHGWKKKNWVKSDKKPVVNTDLWKVLDNLNSKRNIQWNWVKGHAGVAGNERADELARQGLEEMRSANKIPT